MHHPVGCKLSSERRNSLENLLIQKSPKICPKYNELIELNEYNKSAIYSPPFGRGRGGLLHPPDTPDTLLRRVQGLCLSALWHPYTLKHKILARVRARNRMWQDISEHRAPCSNVNGFQCSRAFALLLTPPTAVCSYREKLGNCHRREELPYIEDNN